MNGLRYVLRVFNVLLVLMWAGVAMAATTTLLTTPEQPIVLDPVLIGLSCVVSTLAGASMLAYTVNQLVVKNPGQPLIKPWLLCTSHMLGSWTMGVVAFIACRIWIQGPWESLLAVLVLSLVGSKGLDMIAEGAAKRLGKQLELPQS